MIQLSLKSEFLLIALKLRKDGIISSYLYIPLFFWFMNDWNLRVRIFLTCKLRMKPELEEKLRVSFPFWKKNTFDCRDGWFELIWKLSESIQKILNNNSSISNFKITCLKQKYGVLVIYFRMDENQKAEEEIDKLLYAAQNESGYICEICGEPGTLNDEESKFIEVTCDEHTVQGDPM